MTPLEPIYTDRAAEITGNGVQTAYQIDLNKVGMVSRGVLAECPNVQVWRVDRSNWNRRERIDHYYEMVKVGGDMMFMPVVRIFQNGHTIEVQFVKPLEPEHVFSVTFR